MAIAKTDIKLMEPKRLDDTDAGGGVITGNEILDGVVNNMFPNISRLDRTLGRVALAKGFVQINTADQEQYYGGHMIISEPQSDAGVNVMMVNLADDFDERAEAAIRIGSPYTQNPVIDEGDTPDPLTAYAYWSIQENQAFSSSIYATLPLAQTLAGIVVSNFLYNSGNPYSVVSITEAVATLSGGPEFQSISVGDFFTYGTKSLEVLEISTGLQDSYYEITDFFLAATTGTGGTAYPVDLGSFIAVSDNKISAGLNNSDLLDVGGVACVVQNLSTDGDWLQVYLDTVAGISVGNIITPSSSDERYEVVSIDASGVNINVKPTTFSIAIGETIRVGDNSVVISSVGFNRYDRQYGVDNLNLYLDVVTTALDTATAANTAITYNDLIPVDSIEFTAKLRASIPSLPAPSLTTQVVVNDGVNQVDNISFVDYPSSALARYLITFGAPVSIGEAAVSMYNLGEDAYVGGETLINFSGVTKLSVDGVLDAPTITVIDTTKELFPVGSEGLDPALVGLDSSNLPFDKKVNIIQANRVIVIHSTTEEAITNPAVASTTYPLTGTDYQLIELRDQAGVQVNPALYTVDLVAGSVTMAGTIDLSPYTQPLVAHKRYEDMRLVTAVDHATKIVTLGRPLSQAFTAANTFVSSAVVFGDILSSYGSFFDQITWTDVWQDTVIGSNAGGTYNDVAYPVQVTNAGCVTERWALEFTSATAFNIIGENVGQIGTGVTNSAGGTFTEPLNPETGLPYFKLQQEGWGGGWSTGNVLRFNTIGCSKPVWFIRVTQQGDDTLALTDEFTVQIRGDVN